MRICENYDLTPHNSYKVSATCARAYFPETEEDFVTIFSEKTELPKVILGGGYNIILSKIHYEQDFILVGEAFSGISRQADNVLCVEAGASTKSLSELALAESLTGAEIFYDIPSTIGGAVVMNAGASGEEIKDLLIKVRFLDLADMCIKEINNEDIAFEYRNSYFQKQKNKIILKAWLQLQPGDKEAIWDKMSKVKAARWFKQPRHYPNAGSVFKRPKGYYVGQIIEELGLKGLRIGNAQVSEKHGGFIINLGGATGSDILQIIDVIKKKVLETYSLDLEVEQRII